MGNFDEIQQSNTASSNFYNPNSTQLNLEKILKDVSDQKVESRNW
jgi:hypothetical protein